ncbi:DNA -binding domain-containing protein [Bradyrhizobium brasilense]|uniref:DNA -binding domain-containing protein n=1 Tax=Bradyrhizobium brasilense TaxID=1419277 RepID=UPI003B967EFF
MPEMPPNSEVADTAPAEDILTPYDREHAATYMRMLDAAAEGADWREVAEIVLRINPLRERDRARQAYETHLARARWMSGRGYKLLLKQGWPASN